MEERRRSAAVVRLSIAACSVAAWHLSILVECTFRVWRWPVCWGCSPSCVAASHLLASHDPQCSPFNPAPPATPTPTHPQDDMVPFELFGQAWVLFRGADGRPGCILDECAHRACPLSIGKVTAGTVVCPYHGEQGAAGRAGGRCHQAGQQAAGRAVVRECRRQAGRQVDLPLAGARVSLLQSLEQRLAHLCGPLALQAGGLTPRASA